MRVRTKICGITRAEDAQAAAEAGADAIGFVFWERSPRAISCTHAARIIRTLPPFVTTVALFVDPSDDAVAAAIDAGCDLLQFHGEETPARCARAGRPWIKAVRVRQDTHLHDIAAQYSSARALLLDAFVEGTPGGTGSRFDWSLVPGDLPLPIILAGGLTPENVGVAIRTVRPWAVDVSGGVECAKGIKDHARMAAFIEGARRDCNED